MERKALVLELEELAMRFSEGWHEGIKIDALDIVLLNEAAEALAQPAQEPVIGDIRALKHRIHELEGEVIGYKRILDAQPAQERIGFAGVKIWVGNQQVVKLLTRIELDHAIDPWLHVKLNADMCIATLLKRMSK